VWHIIHVVERKPPKGSGIGYDGDFQTPDLVCENCGAIYSFSGFKKRRNRYFSEEKAALDI